MTQLVADDVESSFAAFDVFDPQTVKGSIVKIEAKVGTIGILVTNVGMRHRKLPGDFFRRRRRELMRINLDSAFFFVGQAVARHMIARRRGKIINIDSLKSEAARYLIAPYTASKGAVKNLIKNNCADWARRGLQINAIGPVYFATPLNHALADNAEFDARLKHRTLGSHGRTAGGRRLSCFGCVGIVTGQIPYVDGGVLATL